MPTVTVDRVDFFRRLGKEYSACSDPDCSRRSPLAHRASLAATKEFDELLFQYGLELDEDVRAPLDLRLIRHSS